MPTLSYVDGDNAEAEAPQGLLVSARQYLQDNPLPEQIGDISFDQSIAFSFLHHEFIKANPVITNHVCWHDIFGSGGTSGVGSGEEFLFFHHRMMEDLKNHFTVEKIPVWQSDATTPEVVADSLPLASNVFLLPQPQAQAQGTVEVPSYLTLEGGEVSATLDGKVVSRC